MPVENDLGFWKWVASGVGGLVSASLGAFVYLNRRFEKKADKQDVEKKFDEVREELKTQRGTLGKVFDQIRESDQRAQDRHERLLERLPPKG